MTALRELFAAAIRTARPCRTKNLHGRSCTRGIHDSHEHWLEIGGGIVDVWTD